MIGCLWTRVAWLRLIGSIGLRSGLVSKTLCNNYILATLFPNTVRPVLSGDSKLDKTKVLKPCGSLMQVKSTAEGSTGELCSAFDLH